jgi:hypothetical protein
MTRTRVAAVDGWFTMDEAAPALIGARAVATSANPAAPFEEREEVQLSRRGRVWSYTTNHYKPPAPYVSPEPFEPYTVLAVQLEQEQMVVLGPLATGADPEQLRVGMEVELVLGPLYSDDDHEYVVWQWAPVA